MRTPSKPPLPQKRSRTARLCAAFCALLVLTGCSGMKSCPNSNGAACAAYQANRPTATDADTLPTLVGILNLDYAMEAACQTREASK